MPACSTTRDHVIAREFFLPHERGALKHVPACQACNNRKSQLERYLLAVLPLGSRKADAATYLHVNVDRRFAGDRRLHREIASGFRPALEITPGGLALPTVTLPLREGSVEALLGMMVRGLYLTDFGFALGTKWLVEVAMMPPEREHALLFALQSRMGSNVELARGDIGRGTFRYEAVRSRRARFFSMWQLSLFGGITLSHSGNAGVFRKLIAVTRPDMAQQPFTEEEYGIAAL